VGVSAVDAALGLGRWLVVCFGAWVTYGAAPNGALWRLNREA
jgi:tryptophan-rich sensory protein